jgi:hypothetical protein
MVFDIGHDAHIVDMPSTKLEIHPVYTMEKITAGNVDDLSGVYADDFGNTYYLRHYLDTNVVWYLGLSPLGRQCFGQVFNGTVDPQAFTMTGNLVALPFGPSDISVAPFQPLGFDTTTPLGDTGIVTFDIEQPLGPGVSGFVPYGTMLSVGRLRLQKLYDT